MVRVSHKRVKVAVGIHVRQFDIDAVERTERLQAVGEDTAAIVEIDGVILPSASADKQVDISIAIKIAGINILTRTDAEVLQAVGELAGAVIEKESILLDVA
ncbi:MAG: hypothetical protein AAF492_16020, partial [Verrucomicrobiota bacterium]